MRALSWMEVPFDLTATVSPVEIPRRLASRGESAISGAGRWNASSSTRSIAGPEKSER